MDTRTDRSLIPVGFTPVLAAAAAALLAAGQLALAEIFGLVDLGGEFAAGAERAEGIGVTLLIWFCSLSAPTAMLLAHGAPTRIRVLSAVASGAATPATLPVAHSCAGEVPAGEITGAVVTGAALGLLAALLAAVVPSTGLGVALHAGLLWTVALVAVAWTSVGGPSGTPTYFAGFVLDTISDDIRLDIPVSGSFGYFPRRSLVMIVLLLRRVQARVAPGSMLVPVVS